MAVLFKRLCPCFCNKASFIGSIYITDPYHSKASENFVRELLNELKSNCSSVSPEILAAREVKNIDVEKHFCLICVCNNASRIDSDIEFCESYINDDQRSKTVFLILNVGNATSRPRDLNISKPDYLGVIQMGYDNISRENIRKRNKEALGKLQRLLRKQVKKSSKNANEPFSGGSFRHTRFHNE